MKLFFLSILFPLILLNVQFLKGQQGVKTYQPIVLRFSFHSFYNSYKKFCCKIYSRRCDKLLDSTGFTADSLKGRVTIAKDDGWIEFKISRVQSDDAGYYRCLVEAHQQIYSDYNVELSEVLDDRTQSQPSVTPTIKYTPSGTLPQFTATVKSKDLSEHRSPWRFGLLFIVTVSMAVMLLITSITGVIFCRFKANSLDKREILQESLKQDDAETSGPVYTTVNFRTHQEQAKVHKNPRMCETQVEGPDGNCSRQNDDLVEYAALACHK